MLFGNRHFWRRVRRSVVAAATVAAVAACAIGVPHVAPVAKSHAERYPCENHPCGCADAESCWRDCCCMNNAAKLAWAEKAGVTPPSYVLLAAAREAAEHDDHDHKAGGAAQLASDDCCETQAKTCCSEKNRCCSSKALAKSKPEAVAPAPTRGVKLVQLVAAMKCRGLSVSVAVLPPSLPVICSKFFPLVLERYQPALADSIFYDAPYLAVDSPPPRAATA